MKKFGILRVWLLASLLLLFASACSDSNDESVNPGVNEEPKPTPDPDTELKEEFAIAVINSTPLSFEVSFTPTDGDKTYYWNCLTKADFEKYADEDAVISGAIDFLKQSAAAQQMAFEVFLKAGLRKGYQEWGWDTGIDPNSDYVVYCFGLATDGTVTTKLSKLDVRTPGVASEQCTFEIEVNEELTTASKLVLTVKPSNNTTRWYASVFEEEAYYEFCGSTPEGIPAYLKDQLWPELLEIYGAEMGYSTIYDVVRGATKVGEATAGPLPIYPNQNYYLFAVGVGVDGSCVTEPKVVPWTAPNVSDMQIQLNLLAKSDAHVEISLTPTSGMETYAYVTVRDEMLMVNGQMPDDETIIARCMEMTGEHAYPQLKTHSGGNKVEEYYLYPNTAYHTYAFGYAHDKDKGMIATTGLFSCKFTTDAARSYGDDAVGISVLKAYKDKLAVKFTPKADPMMTYYFDIMPEAEFQSAGGGYEAIVQHIQKGIKAYMDYAGVSEEAARVQFLNTDERTAERTGLKVGTAYRIYAVGMYADGTLSSSIATLKAETLSEMMPFEVQWTTYNTGTHKGAYCYLFIPTAQQRDVDMWYRAYKVDDTSLEALSDDELAEELRTGAEEKKTNYWSFKCEFTPYENMPIPFDYDNSVAYVYAVYFTKDGQHGPVVRTRYGKQ